MVDSSRWGRSLDPWCETHERSASVCMRRVIAELRRVNDEVRTVDIPARAESVAVERDALRAEVKQLTALVADMWINADNWSGPNASSHYRSDISFRVRGALQPTKDGAK